MYAIVKDGIVVGEEKNPDRKFSPGAGFPLKTDAELILEGTYPLVQEQAPDITWNQTLDPQPNYVIGEDSVTKSRVVVDIPIESAVKMLQVAIQNRLDEKAKEKGYDSAISCISYMDDINPTFAAEAQQMKLWRGTVWSYCIVELEKLNTLERAIPYTIETFIEELPAPPW